MSRNSDPIKLGIVGVGKIVRDQHLPALAKDRDYRLVAAASRHGKVDGIANFPDIEDDARRRAGTRGRIALHAAAIPLRRRADGARSRKACLPGKATRRHGQRGRGSEGTGGGKRRLAVRQLAFALRAGGGSGARISRPRPRSGRQPSTGRKTCAAGIRTRTGSGRPGGFGVFDPGINALSIATHILPAMYHHLGDPRFSRKPRRPDRRAHRLPHLEACR